MKDRKEPDSTKGRPWDELRPGEDKDKDKKKEAEYRQHPTPHAVVINVIVGDIAARDDSNSTWKKLYPGLKISPRKIKPVTTPLHGFGGATVIPDGTIQLPMTLGTYPTSVVIMTSFLLVKAPMAYNVFYGHPLLNAARAVGLWYQDTTR
ncbi:Uncharacterized protein Adt_33093 [Abeliophyllum distichum]|uniref:Uncharacterized protein n=1 Tax=Abeliophyllum distichum TaxID=126358 RepID=A0ABD1QWJ9_9LAMI